MSNADVDVLSRAAAVTPVHCRGSPLGYDIDAVKRLEDAGCAAIVLPSLFEEQITLEQESRVAGVNVYDRECADILALFPEPEHYAFQPDGYAEHVRRVKSAVAIPVIASLNGRTKESWLKCAALIQEAGADALELNMYQVVTELTVPAAHVEARLVGVVEERHELLRIPIAVKLSPFFTAIGNVAKRLSNAGADGLVLDEVKGALSLETTRDPSSFERAHYIRTLQSL